jgi:hypothetical protein
LLKFDTQIDGEPYCQARKLADCFETGVVYLYDGNAITALCGGAATSRIAEAGLYAHLVPERNSKTAANR